MQLHLRACTRERRCAGGSRLLDFASLPDDLIVIHQEYEYGSTLGFYLQHPDYFSVRVPRPGFARAGNELNSQNSYRSAS